MIGDVHSHYEELILLYKQLLDNAFDPRQDQFILLGDMVDIGNDAKNVIQWCIDKEREFNTPEELHFIFLMGNHEEMLLDALNPLHPEYEGNPDLWLDQGGEETLKSYNPKLNKRSFQKVRKHPWEYIDLQHIQWLVRRPYFYVTPDYLFVHAGLPSESLDKIYERANENDPKLWYDMVWIRDDFIYSSFDWGKRIIFAHTAQNSLEPIVMTNKIGLNTMPRNKGCLTALEIPSMKFYRQPKL